MRSVLISLLLLVSSPAFAKVALIGPTGGKGNVVKRDLLAVLEPIDEVISEAEFAGKERRPKKAAAVPAWIAARWSASGVDAAILAQLTGRKLKLTVYLREQALAERTFPLNAKSSLAGKNRGEAAAWLGEQIELARAKTAQEANALAAFAPPTAPEAPAAPEKSAVSTAPADEPGLSEKYPASAEARFDGESPGLLGSSLGIPRGAPAFLYLSLDLAGLSRGLGYTDPITTNIRPYKTYFMPTIGGRLELFPLGVTGSTGLAGLGLFGHFQRSFGSSAREGGPNHPTAHTALGFGLQYRASLSESFFLIPALSYQSRSFALKPAEDGTEENELPDVSYSGFEAALGLEVGLASSLALIGRGSFTRVTSTGEIISTSFHRGGRANAVLGMFGARLGVASNIDLELGVTYQHYFFTFRPQPGDRFVAGGALDQYVTATGSVRVAL